MQEVWLPQKFIDHRIRRFSCAADRHTVVVRFKDGFAELADPTDR
jgi:hypothetical protein